jgi:hypothetical protein
LLSGVLLSRGLISAWLVPGLPMPWPSLLIVTVGAVLLAAFAVSVAAVGTVLSGSLSAQLTGVRRPAATKRYAVIAELVLVAIAVAVLASKLSVKEPGDPDVTDMILPIVLAAVAGLGMTRLVSLLARWRSRRAGRTLAGFVATRALGRRAEGTLVILPLTAAIAVGRPSRSACTTPRPSGATRWRSPPRREPCCGRRPARCRRRWSTRERSTRRGSTSSPWRAWRSRVRGIRSSTRPGWLPSWSGRRRGRPARRLPRSSR